LFNKITILKNTKTKKKGTKKTKPKKNNPPPQNPPQTPQKNDTPPFLSDFVKTHIKKCYALCFFFFFFFFANI
jgi:hypothetical protein